MKFEIKATKEKEEAMYKSIYIKRRLAEKIDQIAAANSTSWNNVVISMIEACLAEQSEEEAEKSE